MANKRCFIAIELPEEIKNKLGEIQNNLKSWPARVKWVEEQNMHLTLKFLGDINQIQIEEVKKQLQLIGEHLNVFEIEIKGFGSFPNMKNPKVIWVGVHDGDKKLQDLRNVIEEKLEEAGFKKETTKFSPHLTLGRVKDLPAYSSLNEVIKNIKFDSQRLKIGDIRLMESILTPKGPLYSCIHAIELQEHSSRGENIN